ncbi:Crp/Fnr family transcriptional regulator [Cohnella sp. WQ 127256]|uniref:Crp/Fnr family transcriptional regulator n=1 Tax=Cohnella sp. WQ 127256 TaxID=2938790 RepID=UPI0021198C0B|nr:Crp/Fnr family transcriptional regulator [Cohnella sp. WQ 127256]
MDQLWESIYARLQRVTPIPDEEWAFFKGISAYRAMTKNSHFIRAGEPVDSIGICVSGLFRFYYTTPDGNEFNKSFCTKHDFIASYSSLLLSSPSFFSIQALMDSELIVFRYTDFQSLYSRHACWERLGRLFIEQLFVKKEIRERELLLLSAEERYLRFLEQYEHLMRNIPQYHIASYLGITPVALSRIRKKLT